MSPASLISTGSILLPFVSGLTAYGKLNKIQRSFFWFLVFSVLFDALNTYVGYISNNNLWMFRIFLICDFAFFVWYYHNVFDQPLWDIRWNILPMVLILCYQILPSEWWLLSNSVSWFHLLIFIFFIVQGFFAIIRCFELYHTDLLRSPAYWVSFARLFYFMMILFAFILPEFTVNGSSSYIVTLASNNINSFSNICLNALYAISFLCLRTTFR